MAITLVASTTLLPPGINSGTSTAIDTSGANLLVVRVAGFGTVTLSDSKSNTWIKLTERQQGGQHKGVFYYCLGALVGTGHTFTISGSGIYAGATIHAFSGVGAYQTESGNISASAQPVASGSVTPATDGALILTSMSSGGTGAPDTVAPAGFTTTVVTGVPGQRIQVTTGYLVQATAAAINPTWSWTGTHDQIAVTTAVFLATLPVTPPLVAFTARAAGAGGWPTGNGGATDPLDTTGATLLVLSAGWYWNGSSDVAVSDSKGNTWLPLTRHTAANAAHRIYYAVNPTVGPGHTFTVTLSGGFPSIVVYAFSGAVTSTPFDVENGAGSASGSGALATGAITPSISGAYLVSGAHTGNGVVSSVTTDLASHLTQLPSAAAAYTIQSPAAAINPSWSYTGSTQGAAVSIAAFRPPVFPVPNVFNALEADAVTTLTTAGFTVGTITYVPPTSVVTAQAPPAGTSAVAGYPIDLTTLAITTGHVVSQSPVAGSLEPVGTPINLVVVETLSTLVTTVTQAVVETLTLVTTTHVTQATVEVLSYTPVPVRVTHAFAEVFARLSGDTFLTQLAVEVFHPRLIPVRETQVAVEILFPRRVQGRVTQAAIEVWDGRPARVQTTQTAVEVFLTLPPCVLGAFPVDDAPAGGSCPAPILP